jgi:hypothetical protein
VQTSIVVNSFCGYFKVDIQQAPAPSVENLKNKKLENIQNAEISYIICRCVEPKMIRSCYLKRVSGFLSREVERWRALRDGRS